MVRKTSGAIHRGVPTQISGGCIPRWLIQHVCKKERRGTALSKSQSLTIGVPSDLFLSRLIKMFPLFTSRWIMSLECSSDNACATSLAICNANSIGTCFSPSLDSFSIYFCCMIYRTRISTWTIKDELCKESGTDTSNKFRNEVSEYKGYAGNFTS